MPLVVPSPSAASDVEAMQSAVEHMNVDHAAATLLMVQLLGGLPDASEASVLSLCDRRPVLLRACLLGCPRIPASSCVLSVDGAPSLTAVSICSDRYGFDVLAQTSEGPRRTRIGFAQAMRGVEEESSCAAAVRY
eukprot:COSAG01_NODE_422_length_17262_cov_42.635903_3_plen_135_part_00